jgi:hypothetical protein
MTGDLNAIELERFWVLFAVVFCAVACFVAMTVKARNK